VTVEFPVYIDCTYQNRRYNEHGVARHGYVASAAFIDSPRDARYHYAKRFGIEASHRLSGQSIATTSTQNPVVRLLYVVVNLLL
jgi:IS4 transposase